MAALGAIETQIGGRLERAAKLARAEAANPLQVELEAEAGRRKALEAELDALKVRDAAQRREVVASAAGAHFDQCGRVRR